MCARGKSRAASLGLYARTLEASNDDDQILYSTELYKVEFASIGRHSYYNMALTIVAGLRLLFIVQNG
jgi:hypothetical protein